MRAKVLQFICAVLGILMNVVASHDGDRLMMLEGSIWAAASVIIWAVKDRPVEPVKREARR